MYRLARQASIIVGQNKYFELKAKDAWVPELHERPNPWEANRLSYGWILQTNLFCRQLVVCAVIAVFYDNPPVTLAILCFLYGVLVCALAFFRPYMSMFVTTIEGTLTGCLCLLAWSGCMTDLMSKNRN